MARPGRPKMPPGEAKTTRFGLRLTPADKALFRGAAARRGVSLAAWIIEALRAAADAAPDPESLGPARKKR